MQDAQRPRKRKDGRDEDLARLIRQQLGVVTRAQLLGSGMHPRAVARRLSTGELVQALPAVYLKSTVPESWEQRVIAALLWAGDDAAASHSTAAVMWGLTDRKRPVIEISVTRSLRPRAPWLRVHRRSRWESSERRRRKGMWVTTPEQTLLELGISVTSEELEECLECAIRLGLTTFDRVQSQMDRNAGFGRRGCKPLRKLMDRRGNRSATESPFETKLNALALKGRLPVPERQYEVTHKDRFLGRIDFAYPHAKVGIEADSWKHHFGRKAWQHDSERGNNLLLAGWRVLRFTYDDLCQRPDWVIAKIRDALGGTLFA